MKFAIYKNEIHLENEDNFVIAKVCFEQLEQDTYNISFVFVDENFRGQNIASKIMDYTVKELKNKGAKSICATCPYAAHWLERNSI